MKRGGIPPPSPHTLLITAGRPEGRCPQKGTGWNVDTIGS